MKSQKPAIHPPTMPQTLSSFELAARVAQVLESKQGQEIRVLATSRVTELAEYFIFCSGDSRPQLRALSQAVREHVHRLGQDPIGVETDDTGRWTLIDYGDVVVHIMHPGERTHYQLEQFWSHADRVPDSEWQADTRLAS